jgi:hypothetical protein
MSIANTRRGNAAHRSWRWLALLVVPRQARSDVTPSSGLTAAADG